MEEERDKSGNLRSIGTRETTTDQVDEYRITTERVSTIKDENTKLFTLPEPMNLSKYVSKSVSTLTPSDR